MLVMESNLMSLPDVFPLLDSGTNSFNYQVMMYITFFYLLSLVNNAHIYTNVYIMDLILHNQNLNCNILFYTLFVCNLILWFNVTCTYVFPNIYV